MTLCSVCVAMFAQRETEGLHHESLQEISDASANGCRVCYAACEDFKLDFPEVFAQYTRKFRFNFKTQSREGQGSYTSLSVQSRDPHDPMMYSTLLVLEETIYRNERQGKRDDSLINQPLSRIGVEKQMSWSSAEERGIDRNPTNSLQVGYTDFGADTRGFRNIAANWLDTCRCQHQCGSQQNPDWHPRRLLEIMDGGVKLVVYSDDGISGPYVALSHCWGANPKFLTLTASNRAQFSKGIRVEDLPANFRDAVSITATLGFQFLWIDSLCILQAGQGSKEDWLVHAVDMASIYSNSTLNLSSHHAEDATQPCFASRNPQLVQACLVDWHGFSTVSTRHIVFSWNVDGQGALKSSRLSSRGWVIQERLLSPRVLHFTKSQIFWECNGLGLASESFPFGVPKPLETHYSPRPFSITSTRGFPGNRKGRERRTSPTYEDLWPWLVREYTKCGLTKPDTDILVALAGVARQLASLRKDQYCAGLWSTDLLWQITWTVLDEDRPPYTHRSLFEIHPTWSWAGVKAPVEMPVWDIDFFGPCQLLASVHGVHTPLLDANNPFSAVKAGSHLTLRGLLFAIKRIEDNTLVLQPWIDESDVIILRHHFDFEDPEELQVDRVRLMPIVDQGEGGIHMIILRRRMCGDGFERIGTTRADAGAWLTTSVQKSVGREKISTLFLGKDGEVGGQRELVQIF